MFITFEGGEGSGKSTQIRRLATRLQDRGHDLLVTREPGGTPEAEAIRSLLVSGDVARWTPQSEALLNYAAREQHLEQVIRPALAAGKVVLCDRFMDSTRAYQGYAGGVDLAFIDALEKAIVASTRPGPLPSSSRSRPSRRPPPPAKSATMCNSVPSPVAPMLLALVTSSHRPGRSSSLNFQALPGRFIVSALAPFPTTTMPGRPWWTPRQRASSMPG